MCGWFDYFSACSEHCRGIVMNDKYKTNFMDIASKLDAMTESCGKITNLARNIVDNIDNSIAIRSLAQQISDITLNNKYEKEIKQFANALKNSLIEYCGYRFIKSACETNNIDETEEDFRTLEELLAELDTLIGLENVKQKVNDLITYQEIQKKRREMGLFSQKSTLHMAFTGNPGTGKTTVARIVGHIYKKIGLLSNGHFVEVSRTDLIAGYQGQTALKVKEVIEKARGGVLFIDEAYSITENDHSDSYGRECLTELTKALEDYRDDLVVIVAGYTEPMNKFFESNPGLKSRFNTFIEFEDYSADELMDILKLMCLQNAYGLDSGLMEVTGKYLKAQIAEKDKNFANARMVRNLYESLVMNHAKRVVKLENPTKEDLSLLLEKDFSENLGWT
jgi:SpoVK/Ycf46/Vps4 family AAA+-type ATPase